MHSNVASASRPTSLVGVLILVVTTLVALALDHPPPPSDADAPAQEFSAARAMTALTQIAAHPRPLGSAAHDAARDFLISRLRQLGADAQLQRTDSVSRRFRVVAHVENIVARVRGTSGQRGAVLFVAHYDSVAASPGAADDAAGVAALLESLRAVKSGVPLANDIVLLFTDGEELGQLGAEAFMQEHPWAKDIRVAINFEARGSSGPLWLFETSHRNGRLISEWADAVERPIGSSLTYEVYQHLPNITDATVFRTDDIPILNFAFLGNWRTYHSSDDKPENLDRASLQHEGTTLLAMMHRFGSIDLTHLKGPDRVYFSIPPGVVFHYSAGDAVALNLTLSASVLALLWVAVRKRETSARELLIAASWMFGASLLALITALAFRALLEQLHLRLLPPGDFGRSGPYAISFVLMIIAEVCALNRLMYRFLTTTSMTIMALLTWLVFAWLTTTFALGVSYLFAIPLLFGTVACALRIVPSHIGFTARALLTSAACAPITFILAPLVHALWTAFGLFGLGPIIIGLLLALTTATLNAIITVQKSMRDHYSTLLFGLASLCCFIWAAANTRYGPGSPVLQDRLYLLDEVTRQAFWAIIPEPDYESWTQQYFSDGGYARRHPGLEHARIFHILQTAAPVVKIAPPHVEAVKRTSTADGRQLQLRVRSAHEGTIRLILHAKVEEAHVNGRLLPSQELSSDTWIVTYHCAPNDGFDLLLQLRGHEPVVMEILERSPNMPDLVPPQLLAGMTIASGFDEGDTTIVYTRKTL